MIELFIDPYKDELVSSFFARYHYYSGNIDKNDTLKELCGERNFMAFKFYPSRLAYFEANVNNKKYSADYMIYRHTYFPLYSVFIHKNLHAVSLRCMKDRGSDKVRFITGNNRGNTKYMYCPLCIDEDINKFGEAYFHRQHQINDILICSKHKCKLIEYNDNYKCEAEFTLLKNEIAFLNRKVEFYAIDITNKLEKIAKATEYIMNLDYLKYNKEEIIDKLLYFLGKKHFLKINDSVIYSKLGKEIINYYGIEFFNILNIPINENRWLKRIFNHNMKSLKPVQTIILMLFLCDEQIENFFKNKDIRDVLPYGLGPWPCLNPVCKYYKKFSIYKVTIKNSYASRIPTGTFKCLACGYTYRRKGCDGNESDIYSKQKVLQFGYVWEREFKRAVNSHIKKKDILKKFGIYERFLDHYKKTGELITRSYATRTGKKKDNFKEYTTNILTYIAKNKNCSRSEIFKVMSNQVSWLRLNYPKWIEANLPKNRKTKYYGNYVDYKEIDNTILRKVKEVARKIINTNANKRITVTRLEKCINMKINSRLDKIPKTKKFLDTVLEDVDQYSVRRVKGYCDQLIKKGMDISKSDIINDTAISRSLISEKSKKQINEIINKYRSII